MVMGSDALRIASLLPSATEIVCRLGLQHALVGVTHECDHPPGVADTPRLTASPVAHETRTSVEIDHAVRHRVDGHGSIYELDESLLRAVAPDLILTQELCEVCAVAYQTVQRAARRFDAEATVVSLEPATLDDILGTIRTVGELADAQPQAEQVVTALQRRLEALDRTVSGLSARPRTVVLEWLQPPFAPGHWVPDQVAHAGGEASFGTAGGPSHTTSGEDIQAYQPEVIILAPCGFTIPDTFRHLPQAELPAGWAELPAVRDGNVWAVDATSYFSRPGPRTIDGAEILASILHPATVGEPQPHQATRVPPELVQRAQADP